MSCRARFLFVLMLLLCFAFSASAEEAPIFPVYEASAASIDLGETVIEDWEAFFAYLDRFEALEKVDMFATPVKRKQIDELIARYPAVSFGWTVSFGDHTVRTDATAFSTLHYSGEPTHTSQDLSVLQYCTNLRALDIGHNHAIDLSFLKPLKELRVLILACNRVEDLSPLAELKHLEYLELFSNRLTGIEPLRELPYLAHLNIGYNDIRDFSPLYEMPQLKRLWMKKAHSRMTAPPISDDVFEAIREGAPGIELDFSSNPSEGGWRDEAHYGVFHEYFRTGEYRPFDDSPTENR